MKPCNDDRYGRCRRDQHTPAAETVAFDGRDVTATCSVCGALLTVDHLEWYATFGEASCCDECGEGNPWCECDGGPISDDDRPGGEL